MGASATKSFARSRIFRYGLRNDILSRGQKTKAPMVKGVNKGSEALTVYLYKSSPEDEQTQEEMRH